MFMASDPKQQLSPTVLTILGTIALSAVLSGLIMEFFSGGILMALPSALTLAFVAVKGITLAAQRFSRGA
jgi:hypothetical protein